MTVKDMDGAPSRLRQARSLATEQKLMEAALALLDEGGLERCTTPALAERAGVAVGTIYARYKDKDALIAAALLHIASLGEGSSDESFRRWALEAEDLEDFLDRVARTALTTAREHRIFLIAVREFTRKHHDEDWRRRFRVESGRTRRLILQGGLERFASSVRGGEPALRLALAAIYGAIEVTWIEPVSGLFPASPDTGPFIDALVEMQLRYLS